MMLKVYFLTSSTEGQEGGLGRKSCGSDPSGRNSSRGWLTDMAMSGLREKFNAGRGLPEQAGHIQRRVTAVIPALGICPCCQQQTNILRNACQGSFMQRGFSFIIGGVHLCPVIQQQLKQFRGITRSCNMQRGISPAVAGVYLHSWTDESRYRFKAGIHSSQMQRSIPHAVTLTGFIGVHLQPCTAFP